MSGTVMVIVQGYYVRRLWAVSTGSTFSVRVSGRRGLISWYGRTSCGKDQSGCWLSTESSSQQAGSCPSCKSIAPSSTLTIATREQWLIPGHCGWNSGTISASSAPEFKNFYTIDQAVIERFEGKWKPFRECRSTSSSNSERDKGADGWSLFPGNVGFRSVL